MKAVTLTLCFLFTSLAFANIQDFAEYIEEAQTLVEARDYLKEVKEDLSQGRGLNRNELRTFEDNSILQRLADQLEKL